jgi:thiamine pyridinylase
LRAALYPFIPRKAEFFDEVERAFEAKHPGIDLQIVDLGNNYYDPTEPDSITSAKADVYELDSVFLYDFVKGKRIQELPAELIPAQGEYLDNATRGAQLEGKWFGLPHWVCGNFLFYKSNDAEVRAARNLADLEKALGKTAGAGEGLLIDMKGRSTLGELYLDAAFDRYGDWTQVEPHLNTFSAELEKDLRRTLQLCSAGFCRQGRYHDATGFYARQFARNRGRAFVGYSEALHSLLSEAMLSCADGDKCVNESSIDVGEVPLADRGSQPISWVDVLTIDSDCTGPCRRDAVLLLQFLNSDETFLKAVMPRWMQPSRYLLPARARIYGNAELLNAAPLYPKLKAIIEKAVTPTGPQLNDKLRAFGKTLDDNLPKNERRAGAGVGQ